MKNSDIEKIRGFYTCPDECANPCCKNIEIGLLKEDMKNMSKSGKKGTDYVRKITKSGINRYSKFHNEDFYFMKEKICPFLEERKCSLIGYEPICCKQHPFLFVIEDQKYVLEMCPVGREIAIDYDIASFLCWHKTDPRGTEQKLSTVIEFYNFLYTKKEEDDFKKRIKVESNFQLYLFLLLRYLESTSLENRILMRKSFLNGDLVEALKHEEHSPINEIKENRLNLEDS